MTVFFIVVVTVILIGIVYQMSKKPKTEKSIDVAETLLPESDIHAEIAKTVEAIKSQDPVVVEAPFVAEAPSKPKKKSASKPKPKMKATPKKGK
jgi:hypothetical protein